MKPIALRCALAAGLMLPAAAWAETYKCSVDGKTLYQQQPCANAGTAQTPLPAAPSRLNGPAAAGSAPTQAPVAAPKNNAAADPEAEAFVRRAFQFLATGNVAYYRLTLCRDVRTEIETSGRSRAFDDQATRLRITQTQLTDVARRNEGRISFNATHVPDAASGRRVSAPLVYYADVRRQDDGTMCTRGILSTAFKGA
jgi:hypothetical protein